MPKYLDKTNTYSQEPMRATRTLATNARKRPSDNTLVPPPKAKKLKTTKASKAAASKKRPGVTSLPLHYI
jgi:hypothetical protein